MNQIVLRVVGGFGNQLFMVFNAISLSIDYNLELIIDGNQHDPKRPPVSRYTFFQSDKLKKSNTININKFKIIMIKIYIFWVYIIHWFSISY